MVVAMNPCRLLIVDAHTMVRQGLRALLTDYRDLHVVGEASNGQSALAQARTLEPDVILLDVQMPEEDGLDVAATMHEEIPLAKLIILTAAAPPPDMVYRAIRAGALGFISKDGDVEELVKTIRSVAQGQAVLFPSSLTSLVSFLTNAPESVREPAPVTERLSEREQEVLELVALGNTNRQIAEKLVVAESTVRSHLHNILDKLQLTNRVQAATYVMKQKQADGRSPTPNSSSNVRRISTEHRSDTRMAVDDRARRVSNRVAI